MGECLIVRRGGTTGSSSFSLTGIALSKTPTKTDYVVGEKLEWDGVEVVATYSDGSTSNVTSACTFSPVEGTVLEAGQQTLTVSYELGGTTKTASLTIEVADISNLIYGVSWDGTSTTKFSRTDAAQSFVDPVPYVSGASSYSSPFDEISPWSDMTIVEDETAGQLVKIPKYYYKWTKNGSAMQLQISLGQFDGSFISPAHADRGDGKGERDVVYVGRYHCNSSYKSVTGSSPQVSITRATARSKISSLGSAYWQYDYAMYWTIAMLYLVEFGDWNSQTKIGYGCGNGSSSENVGASDSMPYHTGTMQSSRTAYGVGVQYRYIEGLWDNVFDWCDGIYFSGSNVYCIKNPASFSDTSGGTYTSTRPTSSNYITAWNVPTTSGFEYALFPSSVGGSDSTYTPDKCYYDSSGVVLSVGGRYYHYLAYGLFFLDGGLSASYAGDVVGCRLQKLP